MKALVAYDGSLNSKTALKYGLQKMNKLGGEVVVLHVFNRSMFIDYDGGPGAERMARIESARHIEDARRILEEAGNTASRIMVEEGSPRDEIVRIARAENVDIIYCPPAYRSISGTAPCPVSVIPANILVPLDNTDISPDRMEQIISEAKATGSAVILLGIIPIHIYSKWEEAELNKVGRETSLLMKRTKKILNEHRIETKEIVRSGYPDEEILKVADDYPITMIILPPGGNEPSELSKAAVILSDRESGVAGRPFVLMGAAG